MSYEEEIEEMKSRAVKKKWNEKVEAHFNKEIGKLQRMNPQVAEYSIQRNYLDLFLDLPWDSFSKDNFDLKRAQKVLDRDHFGLEEVKRRIIEYLARRRYQINPYIILRNVFWSSISANPSKQIATFGSICLFA